MGRLRIESESGGMFWNRQQAGELLGQELTEYGSKNAVVLGIPRGGIVVAREIANELKAELDIVLARKLRTPGESELAMGSISEDGRVFLNDEVVKSLNIDENSIEKEKAVQMDEIARRRDLIRRVLPKVELKNRIVIITDDGVATGATFQAAIWSARQESPKIIVGAIPVGAEETVRRLAEDTDDMLCLRTPPSFNAVGQFYRNFEQVDDDEVLNILEAERIHKLAARS